jgi:mRNA deadenylase 3'-5' endonuclease subunit Ccr4
LAQSLSLPSTTYPKPPFPHTDPAVLHWEYRAPRILQIILEHNPTIIGLCEVDGSIYTDYLEPELKKRGYVGFWSKKLSDLADGPALFWRSDSFALDAKEAFQLNGKDSQVALLSRLRGVSDTTKSLTVVVTHLKAKVGFENVRESQVKSLWNRIGAFNVESFPTVVMGDFNDTPESPACEFIQSHNYFSAYKLHSPTQSATGAGDESPWTTWKKRETEVKRTIDYIWLEKSRFEVQKLLEIPKDEFLPLLLPAAYYPSDHLNLVAVVTY